MTVNASKTRQPKKPRQPRQPKQPKVENKSTVQEPKSVVKVDAVKPQQKPQRVKKTQPAELTTKQPKPATDIKPIVTAIKNVAEQKTAEESNVKQEPAYQNVFKMEPFPTINVEPEKEVPVLTEKVDMPDVEVTIVAKKKWWQFWR